MREEEYRGFEEDSDWKEMIGKAATFLGAGDLAAKQSKSTFLYFLKENRLSVESNLGLEAIGTSVGLVAE